MKKIKIEMEKDYKVFRAFNEFLNANSTLKTADKLRKLLKNEGPTCDQESLRHQFDDQISEYEKQKAYNPEKISKIIRYLKLMREATYGQKCFKCRKAAKLFLFHRV